MPKKYISTDSAPKPIGPYSQGVIAGGLFFLSGQIPIDPQTNEIVTGDIESQTECVLKNVMAILKEAKMAAENVVKSTVYLADLEDFPAMNKVYARYFGKALPARSTVQVAALPKSARIEIDVIAAY
ncbi:MAG TPA: RidA family protein [Vicinamibacteria bacterium]|nr:RidA family protein [Vicinamibacteria bacterium]